MVEQQCEIQGQKKHSNSGSKDEKPPGMLQPWMQDREASVAMLLMPEAALADVERKEKNTARQLLQPEVAQKEEAQGGLPNTKSKNPQIVHNNKR